MAVLLGPCSRPVLCAAAHWLLSLSLLSHLPSPSAAATAATATTAATARVTRDRGCHHLRYGQLPVGWVRVEAAASQQAAPTAAAIPGQSTPSGAEPVGTSALLFEIWNSRTLAQDTLIGTALFKVGGCGSAAVGVSFLGAECSHKNHACTGPCTGPLASVAAVGAVGGTGCHVFACCGGRLAHARLLCVAGPSRPTGVAGGRHRGQLPGEHWRLAGVPHRIPRSVLRSAFLNKTQV